MAAPEPSVPTSASVKRLFERLASAPRQLFEVCSGAPDDYMYRESNRTRGLFIGHLDWPAGEYPRLL